MNQEPTLQKRLLSTAEAGHYLGMSARSIHRLVCAGKLRVLRKVHKHWRFDKNDLDAFIENAKQM